MISSPGTGVQQRANFTNTSALPSTAITLLDRRICGPVMTLPNWLSDASGCESSEPKVATNLSTTEADETCPSPTAA